MNQLVKPGSWKKDLFKTFFVTKIDKNDSFEIQSKFCLFSVLQILLIIYIIDTFYESEYKHKKPHFVNETVELYL